MDELLRETELYDRKLPGWLDLGLSGKWVAIFGDSVAGIFDHPERALEAGVEAAGTDTAFLLRQIGATNVVDVPALTLDFLSRPSA